MRFREKLAAFMVGRYGADQLGQFISIFALILIFINIFLNGVAEQVIQYFVLLLLVYSIYRMLSKNTAARYKENVTYLKIKNRIVSYFANIRRRIRDGKTHRFYKCSACKTTVRVPKGKGKIRITCPKCGNTFIRKS